MEGSWRVHSVGRCKASIEGALVREALWPVRVSPDRSGRPNPEGALHASAALRPECGLAASDAPVM